MTASKHLLLILPWLEFGGADKFNLDLVGELARRGWRTTIITTIACSHSWHALFAQQSDAIIDLAAYPRHERPVRLVQIARECGCHAILVSHSSFGYQVLAYARAHLPTVAFVDYCHMEEAWGDGGFPALSVDSHHTLDLQIVSSQHLRQWMTARGANPNNVHVASTNIDTPDWNPNTYEQSTIRQSLQIDPAAPVVLYAARLARQKQPLLALYVMRDVVRARPNAVFLIAGDGQFAPFVRGFIRAHRLERNIRFLGPQPAERVRELLAATDVLFLPSEIEGISLTVYEAMSMGVVPVSAAVGGQAELVTPETGILIQRGSRERTAYTQALLALIDTPARRQAMSTAARTRVETHFQLDQMGERMVELFQLARLRRATSTQPTAAQALASAQRAIAQAEADAAHTTQLDQPLRRWARTLFWRAVERGAWWLVPALERLRWDVKKR